MISRDELIEIRTAVTMLKNNYKPRHILTREWTLWCVNTIITLTNELIKIDDETKK